MGKKFPRGSRIPKDNEGDKVALEEELVLRARDMAESFLMPMTMTRSTRKKRPLLRSFGTAKRQTSRDTMTRDGLLVPTTSRLLAMLKNMLSF